MAFNLKNFSLKKQASKKNSETFESRLDAKREGKDANELIEELLNDEREGESHSLIEGLLHKGKNSTKTSNISPLVEKQNKDALKRKAERQEWVRMLKKAQLAEIYGPDYLKDDGYDYNDDDDDDDNDDYYEGDYDTKGIEDVNADLFEDDFDEEKVYKDLIDEATKGIQEADDDELDIIGDEDKIDDYDELGDVDDDDDYGDDDGEEARIHGLFEIDTIRDTDVGTTEMRSVILSFDPDNFDNEDEVKQEAVSYLFSTYPSLFTYKYRGSLVELSQHMSIDMGANRLAFVLPKDAFSNKKNA